MNFSSSLWNKASGELNSHVVRSKAKKAAAAASSSAAPPPPSSSTSIFSRLSTRIFGARTDEAEEASKPPTESKRAFGFATKNLALYTDKHSEDLYRFKNLSSSYMRSSSPTPNDNEEESATASGTTIDKPAEKSDSDEEQQDSPKTRRPAKK